MAYEKLGILAVKLRDRTVAGDVNWEETAKTGVYQATFSDNTIQISLSLSEVPDEVDVTVVVLNDVGNEIESFTDSDIGPLIEDETAYKVMRETYDTARRMALGTEQVINSIIEALDESDKIPF